MPAPTFEQWYQLNKANLSRDGITDENQLRYIYKQVLSRQQKTESVSTAHDTPQRYEYKGPDTQIPFLNQGQNNQEIDSRYSPTVAAPLSTEDHIRNYSERKRAEMELLSKMQEERSLPIATFDTMSDRTEDIQRASEINEDLRDIRDRHIPYTFNKEDTENKPLMNAYVKKYDAAFSKYRRLPSLRDADANNVIKLLEEEGNTYYSNHKELFDPSKPENQQWWNDLLSALNGIQGTSTDGEKGKEQAISEIHQRISQRVNDNMGLGEMGWRTVRGVGMNSIAAIIGTGGLGWGVVSFVPRLFGIGNEYEGLNNLEYALSSLFVNDIGNYAGKLMQQGTLFHQVDGFNPDINESQVQLPNSTLGTVGTFIQQFGFTYGTGLLSRAEAAAIRKTAGYMSAKIGNQVQKSLISKAVAEEAYRTIASRQQLLMKGQLVQLAAAEGVVNASDAYLKMTEDNQKLIDEVKKANAWAIYGELLKKYGWSCDSNGNPVAAIGEMQPNLNGTIVVQDHDGNYYRITPEQKENLMAQANAQADKDALLDQYHSEAINRKAAALAGLESTLVTMGCNWIGGNFHLDNDVRALTARSKIFRLGEQNIGMRNGKIELANRHRTMWQMGFNTEVRAVVDGISEFSEEVGQGMTAAMMESMSKNSMTQYLEARYLGDGDIETGDLIASGWLGAMADGAKEYYNTDFWRDGISGFVMSRINLAPGNIASNINFSRDVDFKDRFSGFKRQKGETRAQHFDRVSPLRFGHVSALAEYQRDLSELDEYIAAANKVLEQNPNLASLSNALNWGEQLAEANTTGDMANLQSTALGQMTHVLMDMKNFNAKLDNVAVDDNGNTASQYDLLKQTMERVANGNMTDEEAESEKNRYNESREAHERINIEQAKEKAKAGAERVLNAMNAIEEATDSVNKNGKYRDRESRELMVYMQAHSKMYKQDIDKLEKDINGIYEKAKSDLGGDNSERNLTKRHGIFKSRAEKALSKKLKNLEEQRLFLQNKISEIENMDEVQQMMYALRHNGEEFDKAGALAELNSSMEKITKDLDKIKKESKGILSEGKDEDVLSAAEIMKLPSEERAFMLDHAHEYLFSSKQLDVIHNLRKLGLNQDSSFMDMINQHASMTRLQDRNGRIFSKNVADQEWLSRMIGKAKMYGSMKNGNDMAASLENVTNYGDFVSFYKSYLDCNDEIAIRSMKERLVKYRNANFARLKESADAYNKFLKASTDNSIKMDNGITDKHIEYAISAVEMLVDDYGYNVLGENLKDDELYQAIEKIAKFEGETLTPSQIGEVITTIHKIRDHSIENKKRNEERKNRTEPTQGKEASEPSPSVVDNSPRPVVQNGAAGNTGDKGKGGNNLNEDGQGEQEETIDQICGDNVKDVLTSVKIWDYEWINNNIPSTHIPTIVRLIKFAIKTAKENGESNKSFLDRVISVADETIRINSDAQTQLACTWIKVVTNKIATRLNTGNVDGNNGSGNHVVSSGTIETLNANSRDQVYAPFYKEHKVYEFLNSGLLTGQEVVYFYSDSEINERAKGNKITISNEEHDYPTSCVAIVELTDDMKNAGFKGIIIDGKQYQPIGLLPANIGETYDAKRAEYVRRHIEDTGENHIVKDGDNAITMRLSKQYLLYSNKGVDEERKKMKDIPFFKDMNKVLSWIFKTTVTSQKNPNGFPILGLNKNSQGNHSRMWRKNKSSNDSNTNLSDNGSILIWISEMFKMRHQHNDNISLEDFLNNKDNDVTQFNDRFGQLETNIQSFVRHLMKEVNDKHPNLGEEIDKESDLTQLIKHIEDNIAIYVGGGNKDTKKTDRTIFNLPVGVEIHARLENENGEIKLRLYLYDDYDTEPKTIEQADGITITEDPHFNLKLLYEFNLTEYANQSEDNQKSIINQFTNEFARNLILDVNSKEDHKPIAMRYEDGEAYSYAKWQVNYGGLTETNALTNVDLESDKKPIQNQGESDVNFNHRMSMWYRAQAFKQMYRSGIFEISANVTNLSLEIPGEGQPESAPKVPEVSQLSNADYGVGGNGNGDGNVGNGNPPKSVENNPIQKAVDALKLLLGRTKHSDKSNIKKEAISVSEILNIDEDGFNSGSDIGLKAGTFADSCLRLFVENYSNYQKVTTKEKVGGANVDRTYLTDKKGNKVSSIIKDDKSFANEATIEQIIITLWQNVKNVLQDIENDGGVVMSRYTTTGEKTVFHDVQGNSPLGFTLVGKLKCIVENIEHTVPISFQPDMISIDKHGNIHVWDFKTGVDTELISVKSKYEKYCRQLQFYKSLMEYETNISVGGLHIIYFSTNNRYNMSQYQVENIDASLDYKHVHERIVQRIDKIKNQISEKEQQISKTDSKSTKIKLSGIIEDLKKEKSRLEAKLKALDEEQKEIETILANNGTVVNGSVDGVGVGNGGVMPTDAGGIPLNTDEIERRRILNSVPFVYDGIIYSSNSDFIDSYIQSQIEGEENEAEALLFTLDNIEKSIERNFDQKVEYSVQADINERKESVVKYMQTLSSNELKELIKCLK